MYSLIAYDEWTQERLPELAKDRKALGDAEKVRVDKWLDDEFFRKNWNVSDATEGLHVVDRPPLDPLSFTDRSEWSARAQNLHSAITGRSGKTVQAGHVFVLIGDPWELQARIIAQNKSSSVETLSEIQQFLREIYSGEGVTVIDTRSMGISELVKRVVGHVHLDDYTESDLGGKLSKVASMESRQIELGI